MYAPGRPFLNNVTMICNNVTKWYKMKKNDNFFELNQGKTIDTGGR